MDIAALGVAILYDPVFAFLSVPLLVAHQSNQIRPTVLVVAALAALYSYRAEDRSHMAPIDLMVGQDKADMGQKCLMMGLRGALVMSILMLFAGFNAGPTTYRLSDMLD